MHSSFPRQKFSFDIYSSNTILCYFTSQCATADPDGRKRALLIGGGIANFTDVAATFNGIIRALKEKVLKTFSFHTVLFLIQKR